MDDKISILIAEDDEGHALLIRRNFKRSGIINPIIHFRDGEEILNFFYKEPREYGRDPLMKYVVLLDIKMPKIDGIEVLAKLRQDTELSHIPVIMITTTDSPREIEACHQLGCNSYIVKPIDYEKFIDVVKKLGYSLKLVKSNKLK